ncbi:endonuclease NucS [Pseudomonas sp. TNT2022 ID1044]|uniref:endonuclease NucS domain-containing protein n=1 Tax=Pseudomonas sp. TNT2022 ID1044 TaxID=2942636 RepID=UPI0023606AE1|nr:endonuclease NucS domain-containing protein [Pseudomonas sp. TNT2022 ID1044]MDD0998505.1 endonuclease NucS [Pseudomonas sp. TNT2022 ID1044]
MARTIYDKPTRVLLKDMLVSWNLQPGEVFTAARAIKWFESNYPKLKPGSIRAHLVQAATNDPSRLHHPSTNTTDDILFKVAPGEFRRYEASTDPAPIREMVKGDVAAQEIEEIESNRDDPELTNLPGSTEFLLEKDLQRYLAENLECIEPGLKLYEDEDLRGIEYEAGGGRRIDILAVDRNGAFVVIELKVSRGYDRVIGQLLRYMNWVRRDLAEPGQKVRGIIVCRSMSEDLRLACSSMTDVELFEYKLSVEVSKVPTLQLPD